MARVPYPKKEELPEQDRHIYERMVRELGGGHIWLALANHPKVLEGVMAIQRIVDEEGLPPKGKRRPLQIAIEPSYVPAPQPVPLTVGGRGL